MLNSLSEKYGHTALLRQVKGWADHGAGLCIDLGESRAIREESRCGTVSGISAEAGGLRGEPAAVRNQQSRRHDGAQAAGGDLDLSRVGVVGHSMGGQAATRACLEYVVFKACACLDGLNPFFYLRPKPSRKPFLLLINSTWGTSIISQTLAQRYLAAWVAPEVFVIRGTKHNSFDDLPLLDPEQRAKAPSDPIKAHAVIAAIVVEFFDRSFGYGKATRLNSDILQDVIVVDLRQIAGKAPALGSDTPR